MGLNPTLLLHMEWRCALSVVTAVLLTMLLLLLVGGARLEGCVAVVRGASFDQGQRLRCISRETAACQAAGSSSSASPLESPAEHLFKPLESPAERLFTAEHLFKHEVPNA